MAVNRYYSAIAQDTTLTTAVSNSATSLVVGATTGFPTSFPFVLAVDYGASAEELVSVTGVAGLTLTVTRAFNGTTAVSHAAGAVVRHVIVAQDMTEMQSHIASTTGAHGVTGAVVGTTDTQTLSAKTLSSPVITGTVTAGGATGSNGQVFTSTGTGVAWSNASAGTVTSVTAGTGLSGGTITSSGTIAIDSTVATLTGTQTLTNKTIDYNSNTITNLPASNSITLLSTTSISSGVSSVSVSSISQSYTNLIVHIEGISVGSTSAELKLYFTNTTYGNQNAVTFVGYSDGSSAGVIGKGYIALTGFNSSGTAAPLKAATIDNFWNVSLANYASGYDKAFTYSGAYQTTLGGTLIGSVSGGGGLNDISVASASITGLTFTTTTTFNGGTIRVYGVK